MILQKSARGADDASLLGQRNVFDSASMAGAGSEFHLNERDLHAVASNQVNFTGSASEIALNDLHFVFAQPALRLSFPKKAPCSAQLQEPMPV